MRAPAEGQEIGLDRAGANPGPGRAALSRGVRVQAWASTAAVLVGGLVLLGWARSSSTLIGVLPGLVPMNPATATAFILAGLALGWSRPEAGRAERWVARSLAVAVVAIGTLRWGGYLFGFDPGIDRLLFADRLADVPFGPNRMAPNTALGFTFLGLALLVNDAGAGRSWRPAELLALVGTVPSLVALTAYAYSEGELARLGGHIPMALNTAIASLVLAVGIIASRSDHGITAVVWRDDAGGIAARRLLPAALGVPWVLGWARVAGEQASLFGPALGVSLLTVATMCLLFVAVVVAARLLSEGDAERERAAAALRQRSAQAEVANRELEAFSYSVSHDLRSPLRAIDGFARILREDHAEQLDADANRVLGVICDNSQRMGRLIDDLLAFSRVGRKPLDRVTVDVDALAHEVSDELRRSEPERAVEVRIAPLGVALGDPSLIRQVLANLLGNAFKFTRRRAAATIEVGCTREADEVVFHVRDDGEGFDARYRDKLFGVFERLHGESEFEGTGVGLALVQRIVERHGGRVWAEGEVGRGATFYFTLPAAEEGGRSWIQAP